jgi:hypothetical protein
MNPNAFVGRTTPPGDADPTDALVGLEASRPRQLPLVRKLARIKLDN